MKKVLFAMNILLVAIIGFQACQNKTPQGVNCYYQAYDNNTFKGVEIDLVKDMMRNYDRNHYSQILIDGRPMADSRSVWFSLKRLKQFIYLAENSACKNGCTGEEGLGVRLYFSEYTKDENLWNRFKLSSDHNLPKEYKGLHTILLVPTMWDGKYNSDFDPMQLGSPCKTTCFASILDAKAKTDSASANRVFAMMPDETQDADNVTPTNMNNGSLVPPPYPETDTKIKGKIGYPVSGAKLLMWLNGVGCDKKDANEGIPDPPKKD